jgi:hypothetical protein
MKRLIASAFLFAFILVACRNENVNNVADTLVMNEIPPVDTTLIPTDSNVYYFPSELLCDEEAYTGQATFLNKWYSKHLFAMREPIVFKDKSKTESYRFTWLRTFNDPVAIRIEKHNDVYALYWKSCEGSGGYAPGKLIVDQQKLISEETWIEFIKRLNQIDFWNLSTREKNLGMDGAQWILEGKKPTQYHIVDRWTPGESSDYYQCCSFLIDLAELDINPADKY